MTDTLRPFRVPCLAAAVVLTLVSGAAAGGRGGMPRVHAPRMPAPRAVAPRSMAVPYRGGYRPYVPRGGGSYAGRSRTNAARPNNGAVVAQLRAALGLLGRSDHDYEGHRVKAMNLVGTAIRHLQPTGANPALVAQAPAGAGGKARGNPLPQATSDAHLRDALHALNAVHSHLFINGSTTGHARALTSVDGAVQELNLALKTR